MLVFLLGALLGALMGGALCVRYLRQEVAANIGPKIRHIQLQLDNIQAELNRAITTRHDTTRGADRATPSRGALTPAADHTSESTS